MKVKRKAIMTAVAALGAASWYFVTHRFQVYTVRSVATPGVNTFLPVYRRSASKWFSSKQPALDYAATQQSGQGFLVAIVADRNDGILEGYHDHFLTGEDLDAIVKRVENSGARLWGAAA